MRSLLILPPALLLIACGSHRYVASSHPNGKPEVVIYLKGKGEDAVKVMEKVYYPNGQLEYVGHFENGVETGEWVYYYETGTKKFVEHWDKGLEHGIQYDYAPDGQIYRELHYEHGKLVKTVDRTKQ
jgi:antitoxin component YwqK of YwqJK toxin-antitoxin module